MRNLPPHFTVDREEDKESRLIALADKHFDELEPYRTVLEKVGLTREKVVEMTLVFRPDIRKLLGISELEKVGLATEISVEIKKDLRGGQK